MEIPRYNEAATFFLVSLALLLASCVLPLAAQQHPTNEQQHPTNEQQHPTKEQQHPAEAPYLEAAQKRFEYGILQYELSAWGAAARIFEEIIRRHPVNHRTTAAYVMAARARHLEGNASQALRLIEELLQEFPSCTYDAEACLIAGDAAIDAGSRISAFRWYIRGWSCTGSEHTVLAARIRSLRPEELSPSERRRVRDMLPADADTTLVALLHVGEGDVPAHDRRDDQAREIPGEEVAPAAPVRIIAALPLHERDPRRASIVRDLRDGMLAALDMHQGDRAGRVAFEVIDCGNPDSLASSVAQLDRDHRAMVLIGGAFSEDAESVSRSAGGKGMLVLLPTATADGLTRFGSNIYQLNTPMTQRARLLADFVTLDLDARTAVIVAPARNFPRAMAEAFAARCGQLGLTVLHTAWYEGKEEAKTACRRIAELGVKNGILFAPVQDKDDIAAVLEGMAAARLTMPVVGGGNWNHPDLIERHGRNRTIYFEADVAPDTAAPRYQKLADAFLARATRSITREALFGADAMAIALAVTAGGSATREDARKRIANVFDGLRAPVNFLDERVNASMNIVEYHDGILRKHEAFHSK